MPCDVPNSVTLPGRKARALSPGRGARTPRRTPRASARSDSSIGNASNKLFTHTKISAIANTHTQQMQQTEQTQDDTHVIKQH